MQIHVAPRLLIALLALPSCNATIESPGDSANSRAGASGRGNSSTSDITTLSGGATNLASSQARGIGGSSSSTAGAGAPLGGSGTEGTDPFTGGTTASSSPTSGGGSSVTSAGGTASALGGNRNGSEAPQTSGGAAIGGTSSATPAECELGAKRACAEYPYAPAIPDATRCTNGNECTSTCKNGTQTCVAAPSGGTVWAACTSAVGPKASDTCDAGDDSSCNGIANEGCDCVSGAKQACGTALGAKGNCAAGTTTCSKGAWGPCSVKPAVADSCAVAGDDATCNGLANDGCPCAPGETGTCADKLKAQGSCAAGVATCNAQGTGWTCSIAPASVDSCDKGNDANCNGTANDGCTCLNGTKATCAVAIGAKGTCGAGTSTCQAGAWGACSVLAKIDSCDPGNDDSCDGVPNAPPGGCACINGKTQACGACQDGISTCTYGGWGACQAPANQGTWYRDSDGDGYGDPQSSVRCLTRPTGYVSTAGDCCDSDKNAHTGQTTFFAVENACGSWDYNCDGSVIKEPDQLGPAACIDLKITCTEDASGNCSASCTSSCGYGCTTYSLPTCGGVIAVYSSHCAKQGTSTCKGLGVSNGTGTAQACN